MSERYKAFIRELKARLLETGTTPAVLRLRAGQTDHWYMRGAKNDRI